MRESGHGYMNWDQPQYIVEEVENDALRSWMHQTGHKLPHTTSSVTASATEGPANAVAPQGSTSSVGEDPTSDRAQM